MRNRHGNSGRVDRPAVSTLRETADENDARVRAPASLPSVTNGWGLRIRETSGERCVRQKALRRRAYSRSGMLCDRWKAWCAALRGAGVATIPSRPQCVLVGSGEQRVHESDFGAVRVRRGSRRRHLARPHIFTHAMPQVSRFDVLLARGIGATMWLFIFYRAREDLPHMLGLSHPWEHDGHDAERDDHAAPTAHRENH